MLLTELLINDHRAEKRSAWGVLQLHVLQLTSQERAWLGGGLGGWGVVGWCLEPVQLTSSDRVRIIYPPYWTVNYRSCLNTCLWLIFIILKAQKRISQRWHVWNKSFRLEKTGRACYRCPAKPRRRVKWVSAFKQKNWQPTENSRTWSEHFPSNYFWGFFVSSQLFYHHFHTRENVSEVFQHVRRH